MKKIPVLLILLLMLAGCKIVSFSRVDAIEKSKKEFYWIAAFHSAPEIEISSPVVAIRPEKRIFPAVGFSAHKVIRKIILPVRLNSSLQIFRKKQMLFLNWAGRAIKDNGFWWWTFIVLLMIVFPFIFIGADISPNNDGHTWAKPWLGVVDSILWIASLCFWVAAVVFIFFVPSLAIGFYLLSWIAVLGGHFIFRRCFR